jgi:hypothetical protein
MTPVEKLACDTLATLWPHDEPPTTEAILRAYIDRLRRLEERVRDQEARLRVLEAS